MAYRLGFYQTNNCQLLLPLFITLTTFILYSFLYSIIVCVYHFAYVIQFQSELYHIVFYELLQVVISYTTHWSLSCAENEYNWSCTIHTARHWIQKPQADTVILNIIYWKWKTTCNTDWTTLNILIPNKTIKKQLRNNCLQEPTFKRFFFFLESLTLLCFTTDNICLVFQ